MSKRKPTLVIVNQNSGYLMIDLAHANLERYNVVLITGRLIVRDEPLNKDVKLDRIIYYNRNSLIKRLLTWLIAAFQIYFKLIFKYRTAEVIFVTNPPFNLMLPLWIRNKFAFLIYDLYPDALVEQQVISNMHFINRIWEKINKKTFQKAQSIYTISEGIKQLASKYIAREKISVVPLWTKDIFAENSKNGIKHDFYKSLAIYEPFIVLYSGNLGMSQPLEYLLEMAYELRERDDIAFVIAGEGEKKQTLEDTAKRKGLNRVYFLPWQPAEHLPSMLNEANLGFITLATHAGNISVPSKTYNYLGASLPIIAVCSSQSELHQLVTQYACGLSVNPNEVNKLVTFITTVKNDTNQLDLLKTNALQASKNFSPENAKKIVVNKF